MQDAEPLRDELQGGSAHRTGRLAAAVLSAALLVIVGVLVGPARMTLSHSQEQLLVDRMSAAEMVIGRSEAGISSMSAYLAPVLDRPGADPQLRRSVASQLGLSAARWVPALAARQRAVAGVRIAPWDHRLERVRGAHLHRIEAWLAVVQGTTTEPDTFLADRTLVRTTRLEFEQALLDADMGPADRHH